MKHILFKYITIAAALLATAVNAGAQYNYEGGIGTSKQVTGPDTDGNYTIRLETFATGTSTVTKTEKPVDVVLVLDVSGSMDEPLSYNQRPSQAYSYNSIGNNTYYYLYNGEYCEVERLLSSGNRYYLRFAHSSSDYYYLQGTGVTQNPQNGPRQPGGTIWTGVLYEASESKMDALKTAVGSFIETIQENDLYIVERDDQGNVTSRTRRVNESNQPIALGNQVSIVKFASNTYNGSTSEATITSGNHYACVRSTFTAGSYNYNSGYYNYSQTSSEIVLYTDTWAEASQTGSVGYDQTIIIDNYYNCSEVLEGFTPTASNSNVTTLKNAVNGMIAAGATASDYGLNLANLLLQGDDANPDANKVVVFFTDGSPTYSSNFDDGVATAAITNAKAIKDAGATIFSIGVFDSTPSTNGDVWRYMNYVSSNYPNATGVNAAGNDGDSTAGYYQDASSSSADLSAIFASIAQGIGSAEATVGVSTQVRDVVTNSFVLPSTVGTADVHVYTSAATGSASSADDTNPAGWATPVDVTSSVGVSIVNVDANGDPTENADLVKNKALFVTGFDYSLADSENADGTTAHPYGNWVGPRYKNGDWIWAGKKLIITFKVKADGESTGGESLTNTGKSGVYVQGEDGTYTCVNSYEQPHTTLSVNIKIRKTGLRSGESATFEIMRIRPKGYNPNGATLQDKVANLEYNLIGKPIPNTHPYSGSASQPDMSDYYEGMGWEGFKKVILTNKGTDGAEVVKDILALDPYWVYLVLEDDWGWAYTMTGDANQVGEDGTYTTSSVEVNPFRFTNTEKPNAVKHAEAIMINHFQSSESGSRVEHFKSSKVESFGNTNGSGNTGGGSE